MFARKVAARLQPNSLTTFAKLMECEIVPWLRQQDGFLDLITLAATDGREVTTISFWDHEGNAQAFDSVGYPEALKMLGDLLADAPYVKTFDVVGSTCHRAAQEQASETENQIREAGCAQHGRRSYEVRA